MLDIAELMINLFLCPAHVGQSASHRRHDSAIAIDAPRCTCYPDRVSGYEAVVVEHRTGIRAWSTALLIASLALLAVALAPLIVPVRVFLSSAAVAAFVAFVVLRSSSRRVFRGPVTASRRGLVVGDELVCSADELSTGGYGGVRGARCLTLFDERHRVRVQVFGTSELADRLLAGLRPGLRPEAVDFVAISRALVTRGRLGLLVVYCVGVAAVAVRLLGTSAVWIALPLLLLPAVLAVARSRIRVGADGVSIRWLSRERFVSFAELDELADIPHGVLLVHRGERIPVIVTDTQESDEANRGDALRRAVRHAYARHRHRGGADASSVLARGHRDPDRWISHLEELGACEGYREVSLTLDALWAVLDGSAAPASARAGAALLLSKRGLDDAGRERMRATAKAAASPALRAALDAIADEDQGVERALRRL